ncbi:nitroreductase [Paenibacillus sp. TRM 82003]|nr:nitroreductase [Paenibacillus sp. TRM 82003]
MNDEICAVAKAIRDRRTIKVFKPDPVPEGLIVELLNVAVWAPNHKLREPWRFTLFLEEGKRLLVDAILANAKKPKDPVRLMNIPAYLAVTVPENERQKEWDEDVFAAAAFIQNFQLAAWERGLGVKWLTEPYTYQPNFRASIGIHPGEKLIGLLQIGYPEIVPEGQPRTPAENKLTVFR